MQLQDFCTHQLEGLDRSGLLRKLRNASTLDSRTLRIEGREVIHFSSNDYLGLASGGCPRGIESNQPHQLQRGAGASRLISGNHEAYGVLESEIARFKKAEATLVFSSGYAAAVGTIPALLGAGDYIVMDKWCHASLIDGAKLSGATIRVFPHNNLKRCEELLRRCAQYAEKEDARVLLVTESVFSMDGDLAPLEQLVELKERYGAWLMVDEAHATGVLGASGRGGAEHFGVERKLDVSLGTLSKAVGSVGGFICGSKLLIDLLVNRARSMLFSTGLPPRICLDAAEGIRRIQSDPGLRAQLWERVAQLGKLTGIKLDSPIVPILVVDERRAMELASEALKAGMFIPPVRFPTVPKGQARLRATLTAAHHEEDIRKLAEFIQRCQVPAAA
jgi:8-amino-7-oxononanoate synthase